MICVVFSKMKVVMNGGYVVSSSLRLLHYKVFDLKMISTNQVYES